MRLPRPRLRSRQWLRSSRTVLPAAIALLVLPVVGPAPTTTLAAQARPLEAGRMYQAGAVVSSPLTGITLTVPPGFVGRWEPELGALSFESEDGVLGGVWGWSEGEVEVVAQEVGQRLEGAGMALMPRSEVTPTQGGLRGTFDAHTEGGTGVLVAEVRGSPQSGTIAVAALAAQASEAAAAAFVDAVLASTAWQVPGAAAWRAEVEGAVLRWSSSGSDMSTGTTTATGASQSEATLAFCSGRYRYAESSESYVSIEGVSASNSSSDGHTGAWYLVADLLGTPTLYLESTDGRAFAWTVEEAPDGYLIDGYLYRPSGQC